MKYDVIIIGSGIGSLTCASILTSLNKNVLVLEKEKLLGGCMQPIVNENWNWSLGMQYILGYGEKSIYNILLQILTDNGVALSKLDTEFQFIEFYKPSENKHSLTKIFFSYPIITDTKLMRERLIKDFPEEKRKIKKYYSYLNRINCKIFLIPLAKIFPISIAKNVFSLIMKVFFPIMSISLSPLDKISITDVIEKKLKITNEQLKYIIYSYWHLIGMQIDKAPFLYWAISVKMLEGGIYFPNGGAKSIANAYIKTIKKQGGTIKNLSEVKNIIIEENTATGVELNDNNNTKYYAKKIISGAGIAETITNMIPIEQRNPQIKIIENIALNQDAPSRSALILRTALEGDLSKFNIKKATYKYVIGDASQMIGDPTEDGWLPPAITYIFLSIYDDSHTNKLINSVDILQFTKYSYFEKYEPATKLPADIENRITETLLEKFNEFFPGIINHVNREHSILTTPLSVKQKTSHFQGSVDGLDMEKASNMSLQPHTGIKNLYFTGQDMFSQGITVFDGVLTSLAIEGVFKVAFNMYKKWRKVKCFFKK